MKKNEADEPDAEPVPLGKVEDIVQSLAPYNTAPEDPDERNVSVLYGPGVIIQLPMAEGPITQLLVSIDDDTIAWSVLPRICQALDLKMVDPETGRSFG